MSDHDVPADAAAEEPARDQHAYVGSADLPVTGVAAVDEVLAAVAGLEGRPVEEHVTVFEQAHEQLRRALDPGRG